MWNTTFKRDDDGQIAEMTHDFGNGVTIRTDLRKKRIERYHGEILVKEYPADPLPSVDQYTNFLENIAFELNPPKQNEHE